MEWKEELAALRGRIDEIDAGILPLFEKRMEAASQIADIKCKNNLPVQDEGREQAVVEKARGMVNEALEGEATLLVRTMMALSREYQHRLLFAGPAPALPAPAKRRTEGVCCAYQGVPGAWGEQAAMVLFPEAALQSLGDFEDVFVAVKQGEADYGVVPIENSKTGAIGEVYDLLRKYGCYIVGSTVVPIKQCLLAPQGASVRGMRQVLSHPEGLKQCGRYLREHAWEQVACRNTAAAAQTVAEAGDKSQAAIASRRAAELYGLEILQADIMDAADNQTRFVVIAAQPEYDREDGLISATFSTRHRSGALCETLLPFVAGGLNLNRIESRPGTGGSYRFFVEIEGNIYDERVVAALSQAAGASEYFEVLGCYSLVASH